MEWVRLCKAANKMADMYFYGKLFSPWLQWLLNKLLNTEYFRLASKTAWEVVSELTEDKKLRALLCGQFGNYGLLPKDCSFLIQAGVTAHYMDGAYYPIGGSQEISRCIVPTIEAAGGRVFVRATVEQVLVEGGKAVGVRMAPGIGQPAGSGVCIRAKHGVISGAGAAVTESLVPESQRALLGYSGMLKAVPQSISHVYAFIGMKGTTEELGLRAANLWALPVDKDYNFVGQAMDSADVASGAPWAGVESNEMLLFMGFPSVKDSSFATRFPGKSTCELISTAHREWFDQFLQPGAPDGKGNQSMKRKNGDYDALKKVLEEKMLAALYSHYPNCRGHVDYVEVGTPLSNLYYLRRADSYGMEHTPAHYAGALDNLRPQTSIPGLFVTGQDVGSVGIVGALNSGILTAHAVLGYGFVDLVLAKRNLIEDVMALDENEKTKTA